MTTWLVELRDDQGVVVFSSKVPAAAKWNALQLALVILDGLKFATPSKGASLLVTPS